MDLVAYERPERLVDELMASDRLDAGKLGRNDERFEMRVVGTRNPDVGVGKRGFDQAPDLFWVHGWDMLPEGSGRAVYRERGGLPNGLWVLCMILGPNRAPEWDDLIRSTFGPRDSSTTMMLGNTLELVAGLLLLIWGADRFVYGAAASARNLGVPPLLIGMTVVGAATSAPELLVSVIAASRNEPGLAIGNAIGSNIVNIGLVLGCVALVRPIQLRSATLRREMPALLAVSLLTVSLFLDSRLSRVDGLVMISGLVIVLVWLARLGMRSAPTDPIKQEYEAEIPVDVGMVRAVVWLVVGLAMLLFGAQLLVDGASDIARQLGVSEVVIGILLIAFGTSLPELAVSLVSTLKGEYGLAIGNIVGSNIFNMLAVIGAAATITPLTLEPEVLSLHVFVMVAFTLVLFAMTYDYDGKSELSRIEGAALLAAFLAYDTYVVLQNVRMPH